jgi:hypothetical protein
LKDEKVTGTDERKREWARNFKKKKMKERERGIKEQRRRRKQ